MIVFAGINGRKDWRGHVYSTCMKPIENMRNLDFLAPSKAMVFGHKAGKGDVRFVGKYEPLSDEGYVREYWGLIYGSERWGQVKRWLDVLSAEVDMTFICYCGEGKFCHRRLLAELVREWRPDLEVVVH